MKNRLQKLTKLKRSHKAVSFTLKKKMLKRKKIKTQKHYPKIIKKRGGL
jgi:hypothetical protein